MDKKILFKGVATATVTPFDKFGQVNYRELGRMIEFQILEGADALVICGTTGEAPTLSDIEHQRIIDHASTVNAGRLPLICGTGSNDTAHSVMMSKCAKSNGADGLLLVTPYYNRANPEGLIKSYTEIADSVDLPMIIYNVPGRTTVDIPIEVYHTLSSHPNLVGIKEASRDIGKFARLCAELGDSFSVYTGNDDQLVASLSVGGSGIVSVTSNILPKYIHEICQCFFDGKHAKAMEMHSALCTLNSILFSDINPIPIKAALKLLGFEAGGLRLPLVEMSSSGKVRLREEMKKLNII